MTDALTSASTTCAPVWPLWSGGVLTIQSEKRPRDLCISVKLLRAVKLGSTKVATIAVEDFIREMDAGLIEYDHVTKKATRHRSKAKSAASQNK